METVVIVLIIFLVVIFVVLIVGATRYYDNSTIASPLPLREPQIDPENELDLYTIVTNEVGKTPENLAYDYKNTTCVLKYFRPEFNFSKPAPLTTEYRQSSRDVQGFSLVNKGSPLVSGIKLQIGNIRIGVLSGSYPENVYKSIKAFASDVDQGEWLVVIHPNPNLEKYNNEFKIYPTILDPVTNGPLTLGIISSLNFNYNISVEAFFKIDYCLRIRFRLDNRIEQRYPETTTNTNTTQQNETITLTLGDLATVDQKNSQEIIAQLFP